MRRNAIGIPRYLQDVRTVSNSSGKTPVDALPHLPLGWALLPLAVLITLLVSAIVLFGHDTTGGPAQIALLIAGCVAAGVGVRHGVKWASLEHAAMMMLGKAGMPIMILLSIGGLIGVWMAAGIIPTLIVIGGSILDPQIFYLASLLICAVVALAIGSSWTTAGTVGVALIGVAAASGQSLPITAGAIISGVYFGDKLSPLSDTTNLAAALAGTELFAHVRYMLWTTIPAFAIAAVVFGGLSIASAGSIDDGGLTELTRVLETHYRFSGLLLIPLLVMFFMAWRGIPALITIMLSILLGALFGIALQPSTGIEGATAIIKLYWMTAASGYRIETGLPLADSLLSRGGMASMLTTVWLIISAMFFSGMMERSGCLLRILQLVIGLFRRDQTILFGVGATAMATNVVASDQYVSLVIASRMYASEVERRGLAPETVARTSEDFGTVTSPLIPWNTCGAFMAGTLGVPTLVYLPGCIFNLASPVISAWYIATGHTLRWRASESAMPQT